MSFVGPLFLAGFAALALPVLLHLVDRADRSGRRFPSLMFVRRLPYRARRRRALRDVVLLALRCLALALLVLAFARPFTAGGTDEAPPATDLVLLLDRSYSMAAGNRWPRAVAAAEQRLAELGDDERVALVLFDSRAEIVAEFDTERATLAALLADARPGDAGTDHAAAFAAAAGLLAASPARQRGVLLLSDLQRIGLAEGAVPRLPEGVELEIVATGDAAVNNASLGVVEARAGVGGDDGVLRLRVANHGSASLADIRLRVEVEGRADSERRLAVRAGSERLVEFPLPSATSQPLRVAAHLYGDDLPADDHQYLVLAPDTPLRVLLVLPDEPAASTAVFIERALAVARAPAVVIERATVAEVDAATLARVDVVIIDDAPLSADVAGALRARVTQGAGMLLIAGNRLAGAWPVPGDWLPALPGAVREAAAGAGLALRWRDSDHPLPAALASAGSDDGAVADAGVRRFRQFSARDGDVVVAEFDDGSAALIERPLGAGSILLYASTLDPRWGALASTPVFAPLLVQAVRHLAGRGAERFAWRLGEVADLARHAAALGAPLLAAHLRGAGASVVRLPDGASQPVGDGLYTTSRPGFHEIHAVGADIDAVPLAVVVDTRESDAARLQPQALAARVEYQPADPGAQRAARERRLDESGADRLWWWLLLAATLALIGESLFAGRLSAARRPLRAAGGER